MARVCLPAVGYKFVAVAESAAISLSNVTLPFNGSTFDCDGKRIYVFRCLWEDYAVADVARNRNFDMSILGRLKAAWYGRRNLGQRLLQIAIAGVQTEQEAREELQRRLSELIVLHG